MPPKKKKKRKQRQKRQNKQKNKKTTDYEQAYDYDEQLLKLKKQLRTNGLKIREVKSDGNCLFRSLADQLNGNPNLHYEVRSKVADHLNSHRIEYEAFIVDYSFEDYVKKISKDREWGGNLELQIASSIYTVNLVIHQPGSTPWRIKNFENPLRTLHLAYLFGDHYDSVRNLTDSFEIGVQPSKILLIEQSQNNEKNSSSSTQKSFDPEMLEEDAMTLISILGYGEQEFAKEMILTYGDLDGATEALILGDGKQIENDWKIRKQNEKKQKRELEQEILEQKERIQEYQSNKTNTKQNLKKSSKGSSKKQRAKQRWKERKEEKSKKNQPKSKSNKEINQEINLDIGVNDI
ncbi:otu domain-containing protein [Anaeramoeba flamelloides]|uniref:Otu domain-containing protein n=1 Tax=Anaeramoeba flamelloides TaxID=1746091 RepID=A0AAV7YTQ6_9EUKA|nr:otu domain-containing protein [Anaeramoeba flamelloides]